MASANNPVDHGALLRQALRAVEQMKQKLAAAESRARQPIAIIGMGCRFPGDVDSPESFWDLLQQGREAIREVPADRWNVDDYYDPDPSRPGKMVSRFGGFLRQIDQFDASLFGIAPREAAMMDPQQRLLLEVTWEALERAGLPPRSLAGSRTGMYLGIASGDYGQLQLHAGDPALLDVHYASGNAHSIASGRLAYLLGLKGPSLSIDTACSSSLVAVHLACQALRSGECTLAIAGGVNVILAPETTVALSHAHMMSPDGRSKAFDDSADGFARAEGCGVVILKPLAQALADGDSVLAVIRGTALNQDGASSSLTAPHGPSQEDLMRRALADAGCEASDVNYVETHGTGTALGDPIELRALGAVYGQAHSADRPLWIGSLKTNLGHMEAAAGLGGLIKLVLSLEHEQIPAHLLFQTPTRHVPWSDLHLAVPTSLTPWPAPSRLDGLAAPRLGAVSSFGFSGTNAHLIVEQAPSTPAAPAKNETNNNAQLLPLSAASPEALLALVERYRRWLPSPSGQALTWHEIAATAAQCRDHLRSRIAIVASNREEAAAQLGQLSVLQQTPASSAPSLCFLFTGQGSEHPGMGLDLLQSSSVFRASIDRIEQALAGSLGVSISEIWAGQNGELQQAQLLQPALFAFGWALSELWRSWGVEPATVLGHSLGEYVAATVAGVVSPEDALRLVAARGRLTGHLAQPSAMIALGASETEIRLLLQQSSLQTTLSIAAVNGPESVVVSGALPAIDDFESLLRTNGLRHKRLRTSHGFHSAALDPMLDAFAQEASTIRFRVPEIRWISNLTGEPVSRQKPIDAEYWREHLRHTVQFQKSLSTIEASGSPIYLELGTQPQLLVLAESNGIPEERRVASLSRSAREVDTGKLLNAAARLFNRGVDLDWKAIHESRPFRRAPLPTYPFQRQRFWFTEHRTSFAGAPNPTAAPTPDRIPTGHPLLGDRLRLRSGAATFHATLSPTSPKHLGDHVVLGQRVLPGAAYLEMALAAARAAGARSAWAAHDVEFRETCVFDESRLLETVLLAEDDSGRRTFEIASAPSSSRDSADAAWTLHATGSLAPATPTPASAIDLDAARSHTSQTWDPAAFYARFQAIGLDFGPPLQTVKQACGSADESLVAIELPPAVSAEASLYEIHPILLDACLQAAAALGTPAANTAPALPAALRSLQLDGDPARLRYAHALVHSRQGRALTVDITGLDTDGLPLLFLEGLTLVEPERDPYRGWLHEVEWEELSVELPSPDPNSAAIAVSHVLIVSNDSANQPLAVSLAEVARASGAVVTMAGLSAAQDVLDPWFSGPSLHPPANRHIFYLPGVESDQDPATVDPLAWQLNLLEGALAWTQALLAGGHASHLWLVSRGAFGPSSTTPNGASLAAFARSVRIESPEIQATAVDLDPGATPLQQAGKLWQLAEQAPTARTQFALRGAALWGPRLTPFKLTCPASTPAPSETRRLHLPASGLLRDLRPSTESRQAPGPNQVEIAVHSAAINFHEVLSACVPGETHPDPPGGECSGVVVTIGSAVTDLALGDEVVAIASGLMSDFATIPRDRVWKKPAALTPEESATLLIPFLTARWSLETIARLQPGETVLIHAAAGGVGLAAVQEARRLGARFYATAGSEAKRQLLRDLGAEAVYDSRTTAFESEILLATGFRGVDVVLNSLAGEKTNAGLRSLAPRGRFIELGDHTALTDAEAAAIRPDITYHRVHLRAGLISLPPEIRAATEAILADAEQGNIQPLPYRGFDLAHAEEAFRFMAAGHHIGRVLLLPGITPERAPFHIREDAAYVVTGGLSGLGRLVVEWLAARGAGCVLALGRRAPDAESAALFARLETSGSVILTPSCDVCEPESLASALASIPAHFHLRGIFHAAGVLDDASLARQNPSRLRNVLAPKVAGAWNLHQLTQSTPLDCFVLFSSAAAIFGSPGQANHAAANAWLDALAHFRRDRLGLTALSINWGAWSETGAAVRHGVIDRKQLAGVRSISPSQGLDLMERLILDDRTQALVSWVDWPVWSRHAKAEAAANADLLSRLLARPKSLPKPASHATASASAILSPGHPAATGNWKATWLDSPENQRRALLDAHLEERIRSVLSMPSQPIDPARPLQEYGLDSLLAIELRNALSIDMETKLPATTLFDYPTLASLTNWVFHDVLKMPAISVSSESSPPQNPGQPGDVLSGVATLSDDEIDRLLQQKMARTERLAGIEN